MKQLLFIIPQRKAKCQVGQPRKDNSKRDRAVLKAICTILADGKLPSLRDAARESGYTNPSTYISFLSLREQGRLVRVQSGGNTVYLPVHIVNEIMQGASFLLKEMEQQ